ncbi:MAG: isoleucine--tRNA ligase [Trueperaceae bacterium]
MVPRFGAPMHVLLLSPQDEAVGAFFRAPEGEVPMFEDVTSNVDLPGLERLIMAFWKDRDIFRKSIDKPAPKGDYVFYEGPPTANGKPGLHHVSARAYKDLFPRFKTMQGYRVGRKGGWDTHGLPVEMAIEKRLGFTSKQQIEEYGIERFNDLCRSYVFENIRDWNEMTERIGFWLDLENAYVTYHNGYIESCWWVMKQLFERGLLVEDYKTTWHSARSNTTLASHEVAQGYREDVEDPSVYPKFQADSVQLHVRGIIPPHEQRPVFLLGWTTTPWTLAANTGLAVKPGAEYALVAAPPRHGERHEEEGEQHLYLLASTLVERVFEENRHEVLGKRRAEELDGLSYRPLLHGQRPAGADLQGGWRVVLDDYVSLEDGTGVVHLAPAYGDLDKGREHRLPTLFSVGLTGLVMPEVRPLDSEEAPGPYAGMWFKDADGPISDDLLERGLLYRKTTIRHAYPFNWRDETEPLLNVAKKSWYIRTTAVREKLLANNERINWVPDHVRSGRFGKWLENNVDWALSRERYWGAPMPIWESDDGERVCVGSVEELSRLAGRDLSGLELHRPYVDEITFDRGGKTFRRVPYTVDVWFESGAMPYAQWHYQGKEDTPVAHQRLAANFPADYICEAVDQTRGWFYSLHALATLLTDSDGGEGERPAGPLADLEPDTSAFRNVIVLGHIVDENGEKMSKSKGNVVDPWSVLDAQGADALRWYLYSSSPPGATKRFSQNLVEETVRDFFNTLWSTYRFFVMYANLDRPELREPVAVSERPLIDRWLSARLAALVRDVTAMLDAYDPTAASRAVRDFMVDELSNWYVRRNRRRFWKSEDDRDKAAAYASLHEALVTVAKLMAPMAPFMAEAIYRNLVVGLDRAAPESVHLADWPRVDSAQLDEELLRDMAALVKVVELGRAARAASGVKTRQPLPEVLVRVRSPAELAGLKRLEHELLDELNVKRVRYLEVTDDFVDYQVKPNLPLLGKRMGKLVPDLRRALELTDGREIARNVRERRNTLITLQGEPYDFEPEAFLLDARSPEGFAAVEERGYLAALDTRLSPELLREGMARDVVRLVQNARKNAGLEVSDRIVVGLTAGSPLAEAITEHRSSLASEVLADDLGLQSVDSPLHVEDGEVEGQPISISLRKA